MAILTPVFRLIGLVPRWYRAREQSGELPDFKEFNAIVGLRVLPGRARNQQRSWARDLMFVKPLLGKIAPASRILDHQNWLYAVGENQLLADSGVSAQGDDP